MLGVNQYGKAETHLVRVDRDGAAPELRDLLVSVALAGDFEAVHRHGDNAAVLPTDTQKNTVYAFARDGIGEPEAFAARLARHFVGGAVRRARVEVVEAAWERLNDHAFAQTARERRLACAIAAHDDTWFVSGLSDLLLLKTTDSEFHGFARDRYTTLAETRDRVLATAVTARWRHAGDAPFATARRALVDAFAAHRSLSLQQTLYAMGNAVLDACPAVHEVRLSLPNRHHIEVDLTPLGRSNDSTVFHADDRPYGLIEGAVVRPDAPDPGPAWDPYPLLNPT